MKSFDIFIENSYIPKILLCIDMTLIEKRNIFQVLKTDVIKKNSTIKFYYQNTGGFKLKLKNFYLLSLVSDFQVLAITESLLNSTVDNNSIASSKFTIFRLDRNLKNSIFSNGDGVMIRQFLLRILYYQKLLIIQNLSV